jgi:hypothetical protein
MQVMNLVDVMRNPAKYRRLGVCVCVCVCVCVSPYIGTYADVC